MRDPGGGLGGGGGGGAARAGRRQLRAVLRGPGGHGAGPLRPPGVLPLLHQDAGPVRAALLRRVPRGAAPGARGAAPRRSRFEPGQGGRQPGLGAWARWTGAWSPGKCPGSLWGSLALGGSPPGARCPASATGREGETGPASRSFGPTLEVLLSGVQRGTRTLPDAAELRAQWRGQRAAGAAPHCSPLCPARLTLCALRQLGGWLAAGFYDVCPAAVVKPPGRPPPPPSEEIRAVWICPGRSLSSSEE